jgi:hypothetical protein
MIISKEAIVAKSTELQSHVDQLMELVGTTIEDRTPLHQVEEKALRVLLDMGRTTLQILFDLLGTGDVGETVERPEGGTLRRFKETHSRGYTSIFGEFQLERCVYGEREGRKIECVPLDARLVLPESKFSYLLQDWDQSIAMEEPFEKVGNVIQKILELDQHVDSLERMNRQMSESVEAFHMQQTAPSPKTEGPILVQTADGKGVPIRRPADLPAIETHQSKSGPKPGAKKMATLASVYTIEPNVRTPEEIVKSLFRQPGEPRVKSTRPRPQHKRVRASLDHVDADGDQINGAATVFGWMADEVTARNPRGEKPIVSIMDGQDSLWNLRDLFQSDVSMVDILDILHVTPRLWEAAHLFHTAGTSKAEKFVRDRVLRILRGEVSSVTAGFSRLATTHKLSGKRLEKIQTIINYFKNNKDRMRYHEYLAAGYPIASGVIEGACRHVVKDRLERTGMTWTLAGAQAMLALRCIHLSDYWDDFTKFRVQCETERLYPYRDTLNETPWALAT